MANFWGTLPCGAHLITYVHPKRRKHKRNLVFPPKITKKEVVMRGKRGKTAVFALKFSPMPAMLLVTILTKKFVDRYPYYCVNELQI
jgi:hypothetical protein